MNTDAKPEYIICWSRYLADIAVDVNRRIEAGYTPVGGVAAVPVLWGKEDGPLYIQAMLLLPRPYLDRGPG